MDNLLIMLRPLVEDVDDVLLLWWRHHHWRQVGESIRGVDEDDVVLDTRCRYVGSGPHNGRHGWGAVHVQVAGYLGGDTGAIHVTHLTTAAPAASTSGKSSTSRGEPTTSRAKS